MMSEQMKSKGDVEIIAEWKNGDTQRIYVPNTILMTGRRAMAKVLANDIGEVFSSFVNRMIFGDGGTKNGVKKFVDAGRQGLFGTTRVSKPVIANVDNSVPTQVIFTSVIRFDEAVGVVLNEMALQLADGDLYSMTTFPDLSKTEEMQITFNWHINFV